MKIVIGEGSCGIAAGAAKVYDALQAQLIQIFTLDYLSQKEVYVGPDVIPPGLHFLRERPCKHRVAVF